MLFENAIHSFEDARRMAKRRLPAMVFDYIDGAAGEGHGEALNRAAIRDIRLMPRVLVGVEKRSLDVDVLGRRVGLPFGIAPMGLCNLAGAKADMTFAALAARHEIPLGVSTAASTPLETMIEWAEGNAWFQLYFSGSEEGTRSLIARARTAGYETLVLTVDVPEVGRRPRELRRGFTMPFRIGPRQFADFALHPRWSLSTLRHGRPRLANFGGALGEFDRTRSRAGADWGLLARIREHWKGNLVVKGVLDAEDAARMREIGIDAIQVSSHGGRQLDSAPPPIHALRAIRLALGADFPLFYDTGLRSGEDIVKAYAMGADFVFLGRPFSFAMAARGPKGADEIAALFRTEISITLAQLGIAKMTDVSAAAIFSRA